MIGPLDLRAVKQVRVAGTTYHARELRTQLRHINKVRVVVSWKEADLPDPPEYHAASHRGWRARGILGRCVRRWNGQVRYIAY